MKTTEGRCRMSVLKGTACSGGTPVGTMGLRISWHPPILPPPPGSAQPMSPASVWGAPLKGLLREGACGASAVTAQGPARLVLKSSCLCRSQPS